MTRSIAYCLCLAFAAGCSGPSPTSKTGPVNPAKKAPPKPAVERIALDSLPEVDDPVPVDGGRVQVPTPTTWRREGAGQRLFLCRLRADVQYPRIGLDAEDSELEDVDADNLLPFAKALQSQLNLRQPPQALVIGKGAWAGYTARAKRGNAVLELHRLITVSGKRRYTLVLEAAGGTLDTYRDVLYAVAGNMEFSPSAAKN